MEKRSKKDKIGNAGDTTAALERTLMSQLGISFIVPTHNDYEAFARTISSIAQQADSLDQIIIIDSSDRAITSSQIENLTENRCETKLIWTEPEGVYPAQNLGIENCDRQFVQIINAGDLLLESCLAYIKQVINRHSGLDAYIFAQQTERNGQVVGCYVPRINDIWPHQSVVVSTAVYTRLGRYSVCHNFVSDQLFFCRMRNECKVHLDRKVVTQYNLDGISSLVSCKLAQEIFELRRTMGHSILSALILAIRPWARMALTKAFGVHLVDFIRRKILAR